MARSPLTPHHRHRLASGSAGLLLVIAVLGACSSSGGEDSSSTTAKPAEKTTTTSEAKSTTTADEPGGSGGGASEQVDADWATTAADHRGQDGKTFDYVCPPNGTPNTIWGVETYTDDSSVCTAAVHVGLITVEEGGTVTIEIGPGQDTYETGIANDITSSSYGSWDGSFTFPEAPPGSGEFEPGIEAWAVTAAQPPLEVGATKEVRCPPDGDFGSVWGTDTYTADSSICTAAIHAGRFDLDEGGTVTIEVTAGEDSYTGSTANGVTTSDYGEYGTSFVFTD